jgi:hypothetical protein
LGVGDLLIAVEMDGASVREELAQEPIDVLAAAALIGAVGIAELEALAEASRQMRKLRAAIGGEAFEPFCGQ